MANVSRIGQGYIQFIPVIGDMASQLAAQINASLSSTQVTSATASSGQQIGSQVGNNIGTAAGASGGQAAASGMGTRIMGGLAALGIAAFLSDAIGKGFERQGSDNKLAASLNLSSEESKKLAAASAEIYSGAYGESYEAVNDSMKAIVGSIKGARDMSQDDLVAMGKNVSNLSDTFGLDAETITSAAQSMIGSGMADNFEDAMSTILAGYQTMGSSGADWIDSLDEFSADFKTFGLDGESGLNLINSAMDAGIMNTSVLSDSLNELGIKIGDGSADEVLAGLGMDPEQIRAGIAQGGEAAQKEFTNIIAALQAKGDRASWAGVFGTQAEDYFDAFQNLDLTNLNQGLTDGIGNLEEFDTKLGKGGVASMESFKRSMETAFLEVLQPALEVITPLLSSFVGFLKENEWAAGAIAVVMGGVLLVSVIAITAALWAMLVPILANPLTWIILAWVAGIALLIAAIVAIAMNWETIAQFITNVWNGFIGWWNDGIAGIGIAWNNMLGGLADGWNWYINTITGTLAVVGEWFTALGTGIANFFIMIINAAITALNWVISAINSIQFQMPDWLGGMSWGGFGIPLISDIPQMAKGGLVKPTPGGTLVNVAEANKAELIVDEGVMNKNLALQNEKLANSNSGGATYNIYQQPGESAEELTRRIEEYKQFTSLTPGYNYGN